MTKGKMVEWHHRLNAHEFEQALGDGEGKGSLVCCSPWGRKESDITERLDNPLAPSTPLLQKSVQYSESESTLTLEQTNFYIASI